ncbi:nitrate reductase [Varunaivibrio sulfuroxidans]|uniref:Assimilatory nitrate reductase (NADH) alpha subunit apoprotein n=1 Tax=Varunaivibrio sulfuroxidans TaxID=1773489 RepID=A0A4R3JBQ8_9PROT|nr:nitrate reductase [Varunaivibrio sulfuroxidans]TCS62526.1 assimilatory nitrate reductase (NADH) alpha subunit apoprotein [Varunaivibrio sulfuroxidans]WES30803.1 molybdopterin-dependent oxidoreductase [Varunaivibrio sulfuroxidans]
MTGDVRTTCPYCGVGCGVIISPGPDDAVTVTGDPDHPANFGRLCSKGAALGETLVHDGRLMVPKMAGRRVSWAKAVKTLGDKLTRTIAKHGPDSVAFYVSGQLLNEDYYVANKLMKGFIGSANIDTNSRLCMASSVAGHIRAFGADTVPGCYEDFDTADLVLLIGSNTAWCHPVLFQRLREAQRRRGTKVVVIDPRRTDTCATADLHIALKPGTDTALFNGLLTYLEKNGKRDAAFVAAHTRDVDEALARARKNAPDIAAVAGICDVDKESVARLYAWFAEHERVVCAYSQGVNQSHRGTDKVNAIINCHLLTGRIGREGMGPFSLTGQPNAMGGREVGGLANTLAAHMGFDDGARDRVGRFWNAPALAAKPGLKAVDLFDAVHDGRIKALWIMGTNPAVSLPDATKVRAALEKCPFVAVSDCIEQTDTTRYADLLLPAATWGERDGTVTNSERRISRQRPFVAPAGTARPDWKIICDVAAAMGFGDAFAYAASAEIFAEHAHLSAFENDGVRDFDIGALRGAVDRAHYDRMEPTQWPAGAKTPRGRKRLFADGRFYTDDGRAHFVAVSLSPPDLIDTTMSFPLLLNTGRVRDQWHTMSRTGLSPRLGRHTAEPYLDIHPEDAENYGLRNGSWTRAMSPSGGVTVRVRFSSAMRRGEVFVPIHWNDAVASDAVVGRLIAPRRDPFSGQPASKTQPVTLLPWKPAWRGFFISRRRRDPRDVEYWCRIRVPGCYVYEVADQVCPTDWASFCASYFTGMSGETITFEDPKKGRYRSALIEDGRLQGCFAAAVDGALPSFDWLAEVFAEETVNEKTRKHILAGRRPGDAADRGPVVCSCFGVALNTLLGAIRGQGLTSVRDVGRVLKAGTNCGVCQSEIAALLDGVRGEEDVSKGKVNAA